VSPIPIATSCRELLDRISTQHLASFESNGKWIDLFRVVGFSGSGEETGGATGR